MAKSKHATALFEVMARQRAMGSKTGAATAAVVIPPEKPSSSPRWWFQSKTSPEAKAATESVENDPTQRVEAAPRAADVSAPAPMSSVEAPEAGLPRPQPVAMEVDPDKQQISLRLSYTSALIGGFGVFIALGLAVLIGKGLSRGPTPALANTSTAQLRKNPPTPGVMHLQRRPSAAAASVASAEVAGNEMIEVAGSGARPVGGSTGTRGAQQSFNEPRPPTTFFTDDPHRINGLNYAIIQAYPPQEKEMAEKAAAFLVGNGIPCTVEREVVGWRTTWKDGYILVGIRGFDKVRNNPVLESYKKSIMQVSLKFTNGRSSFKSFEPTMCQWRKSN